MRTRCLLGLALVVLALHALAWRIAAGGLPRLAPAAAGVHRVAFVSVPQRAAAAMRIAQGLASKPVQMAESPAAPTRATAAAPARARVTPGARAPTGAGATRRRAPPRTHGWPVYATRPPPSAMLRYALAQSGVASASAGRAELEWRRDATGYALRLAAAVDGRPPREWQSTGAFDAAGVAPLRLVERERGRDRRALQFDRDAGRVHFSGASGTPAVAPGAQDRWSWIAQLAAIAEAQAARGPPPDHWDLQVAGLRGDLERWTFRVLPPGDPPPELQGNDLSATSRRAPALLHVLRATDQPYDLRIEAWLAPSLHHLPAGLRMSTPPGPWSLSLWQRNS
ncbi:MAG: hypothetical protein JF586_02290 [Burkholderiales bacterium]|nr:hypothetical protein [Burkholderiales bacterium]